MMKTSGLVGLLAGAAIALSASGQSKPSERRPVAEYWVSASTTTGMADMLGGGRPSLGSVAGLLMHGLPDPNTVHHHVLLQLGSGETNADPKGGHTPPPGFGAQSQLPLLTPQKLVAQTTRSEPSNAVETYRQQKPKGKLLIYWGCGEHSKQGQPFILDFATLSADPQSLSKMAAAFEGPSITPELPPSPSRNATYGEWPNAKSSAPANPASLVGDHWVQSDYSPDIRFSLSPANDFMGGISILSNAKSPTGSVDLKWAPVTGAQAFLITVVGTGGDGTLVIWSSSERRAASFAAPQYLNNGDIRRLVADRQLLEARTSDCTVPEEVVQAARQGFFSMTAYGGEINFSDPPRPSSAKSIISTTKVRYRSSTSGLLGQTLRGATSSAPSGPVDPVHSVLHGLGGLIPHR